MAEVHSSGAYSPPAMDTAMDTRLSSRPRGKTTPPPLSAVAGCDPPGKPDSCDTSSPAVREAAPALKQKGAYAKSAPALKHLTVVPGCQVVQYGNTSCNAPAVVRIGLSCSHCEHSENLVFLCRICYQLRNLWHCFDCLRQGLVYSEPVAL